jgi:hypothetical protein
MAFETMAKLRRFPGLLSVFLALLSNRAYLEQILLVKGWSRYTWQTMQHRATLSRLPNADSLSIKGIVTKGKKSPGESVSLATLGESHVSMIETAKNGHVDLNQPALITAPGKKMYLFVNGSNRNRFHIQIKDDFIKMSELLSRTGLPQTPANAIALPDNAALLLDRNERAIKLREVTISRKKDNSVHAPGPGGLGSNACGDYVCIYDILNCSNHISSAGNTQPVAGVIYKGSNGPYKECKTLNEEEKASYTAFYGLHYPKEFYPDDYSDPAEPAFFSTLYWNYGVLIQPGKETELSFYTGDIRGMFKVIVQGVTGEQVVYAENRFEVK